jgi:hypothetical protein
MSDTVRYPTLDISFQIIFTREERRTALDIRYDNIPLGPSVDSLAGHDIEEEGAAGERIAGENAEEEGGE